MRKVFAVSAFLILFLSGCTERSEPKRAVITNTWHNNWSSGTIVKTLEGSVYYRRGVWGDNGDTLTVVIVDEFMVEPRWTSPVSDLDN